MIDVQGYCPMGCGKTLFVAGIMGYITCSYENCPDPSYVSDLLADRETEHIVKFTDDGFTVQHPLRERRETLMDCDLHVRLAELDSPPVISGTYRFSATGKDDKPFRVEAIKATLSPKEEQKESRE